MYIRNINKFDMLDVTRTELCTVIEVEPLTFYFIRSYIHFNMLFDIQLIFFKFKSGV